MDDDLDDNFLLEAADQADHYLDAAKPKLKHTICLQTKFGHNEFRPRQWDIIRSIIEEKRDNCVIMPTGYGKSLLFQYPAVFTNGITLVVSPLISLMQDQVRSLSVANISACFLGSAQTQRDMDARVLAGEYRLVYASPEYIANATNWLKLLESRLTLIAIDEAHVNIIGMLILIRPPLSGITGIFGTFLQLTWTYFNKFSFNFSVSVSGGMISAQTIVDSI